MIDRRLSSKFISESSESNSKSHVGNGRQMIQFIFDFCHFACKLYSKVPSAESL